MSYDYQTSHPAYTNVKAAICESQNAVFSAIRSMGQATDRGIAKYLGWDINRVTPRRGELVEMGRVASVGKFIGEEGRIVNHWIIKE